MNSPLSSKNFRLFTKPIACKCLLLVVIALFYRAMLLTSSPRNVLSSNNSLLGQTRSMGGVRTDKFVEVPQIVWGLNNQKIAFARAILTARTMNRTLLLPNLSFLVLQGRVSDVANRTDVFELEKGSGRRWTKERDLEQLKGTVSDEFEVVRVIGKNPFLWHDHWPVKDYAKVFECMVVVDEIAREADKVVMKIKEVSGAVTFVAVHMRIEIDWMIHCKKLEQRMKVSEICSSKKEIMERVGNIKGLKTPTVLYLAVADSLLGGEEEDSSVLKGWREGLIPFEKKKLGVKEEIYGKYSYLIQSAIDYEVCLRADVFVGNSFSTFSSLIVLERTQKAIRLGFTSSCDDDGGNEWRSYAYNLAGESVDVPRRWMTNMTDSSLQAISYGSNSVTCSRR